MALEKHARNLMFYDLIVTRRAEQAPYPKLSQLVPLWMEAQANSLFPPKEFEAGMVTAILKDMKVDPVSETATLLIEVSDRNAPNATYLDHASRSGRHLVKTRPEGNGQAAHIVISLKAQKGKQTIYLALVESIPSVTVSRLQSFLNMIIRSLCNEAPEGRFSYKKPGGTDKVHPYVPHVLFGAHPSEQFKTDIENGKINGFHLVAPATNQPLGQGQHLRMDEHFLKIAVSKTIPKGSRWKTLLSGAQLKKDEFPHARIFLTPEAGGASTHIDIDVDTGNVISKDYIKTRRLAGISPLLDSSAPDGIVEHLEKKIKDIVVAERTQ